MGKKGDIFVLWGNFPPVVGGGCSRGYRIFKELSKRGYKITVFVGKVPHTIFYERITHNLELIRVFPSFHYPLKKGIKPRIIVHFVILLRYVILFFLFAYFYSKRKPKVLILEATNWSFSPIIARCLKLNFLYTELWVILKKIFRIPVIIYFGNMWNTDENQIKYEAKDADCIVVLDKWMEKKLRELGVKKDIFHVPVCVELDKQRKKPDKNRVLYVGRLSIEKGCDTLIQTILYLKDKIKDLEIIFVGVGAETNDLKKLAKDVGVANHIKFIGEIDPRKIDAMYTTLKPKVLVNPLRVPGVGNVTIEALAYGIPVIKSRISGIDEPIIEDGKNGYLFNVDDPEDLAEKLMCILKSEEHWMKLSENSRETAKEFDLKKVVDNLEKVILRYFD